jgi:hypothetical protein
MIGSDTPYGSSEPADPADPSIDEMLAALEMPPAGLRKWFEQMTRFCRRHGGPRIYAEVLGLIGEFQAGLKKSER